VTRQALVQQDREDIRLLAGAIIELLGTNAENTRHQLRWLEEIMGGLTGRELGFLRILLGEWKLRITGGIGRRELRTALVNLSDSLRILIPEAIR
jgi:hypothetical protein